MTDFRDAIRRRVQSARESHRQEEDERNRHMRQEANRAEQRKERAKTLLDAVQNRLREAAEESDGAMRFGGVLMDGIGCNAYDLYWEAPLPKRGLRVSVNYFEGIIQWTWLLRDEEGRRSTDALDFDMETLDRLILGLAEQKVWAGGHVPRI